MITVDDIKATVRDYAIDKCTVMQVVHIQRYFIKKYLSWLPCRFIAEQTGAKDHTVVNMSINKIKNNGNLKDILKAIESILDRKFYKHSVR